MADRPIHLDSFQQTTLWRTTLSEENSSNVNARSVLREAYLDFRGRVALLVGQIARDLPDFTVHDITHLDALWETASAIAGPQYILNPAEAFVLGGAILLHDAGMSLAAYPNRLDDLKKTIEWGDAVAVIHHRQGLASPQRRDIEDPPPSIARAATSEVLRVRHAIHAVELAVQSWKSPGRGDPEYLIQSSDLRDFYGEAIGMVAHSHWLNISELEGKLSWTLGAHANFPQEWSVDLIKVACLLRVADASHIDSRRAPKFLRAIVRPAGMSDDHWNFQSKLAKPKVEGDALIFTSGPSFSLEDADAWWVCHDTIRMIDGELRGVDGLLADTNRARLRVRSVRGIDGAVALSKYIRTKGWRPIDTQMRVSNVSRLAKLLGGEQLYGKKRSVALRELIQNAVDAIRALRHIRKGVEYKGSVSVTLQKKEDSYWLSVSDNGVGMSERAITEALLDFGKSFWSSDLARLEFPGLAVASSTFAGRFGIGFFSVFILGSRVTVASRRFDAAPSETRILDFRHGLDARPLLRDAAISEQLYEGGTIVSVELMEDPNGDSGLLGGEVAEFFIRKKSPPSLAEFVGAICPSVDVDIWVTQNGTKIRAIEADDWVKISPLTLLARIQMTSRSELQHSLEAVRAASRMSELRDDRGKVLGRAALGRATTFLGQPGSGALTCKGFFVSSLANTFGVVTGTVETVTRDVGTPDVKAPVLRAWATEQAERIAETDLDDEEAWNLANTCLSFGADPKIVVRLPIVRQGSSYLAGFQLAKRLVKQKTVVVCYPSDLMHNSEDGCRESEFDELFELNPDVYVVHEGSSSKRGNNSWAKHIFGPEDLPPIDTGVLFRVILAQVWRKVVEPTVLPRLIGHVEGVTIERNVLVFTQ